jgi:hypothetical protein
MKAAAATMIAAVVSLNFRLILILSIFSIGSLVDCYRNRRRAAGLSYAV